MNSSPETPLATLLTQVRRAVQVEPLREYRLLGVRWYGEGLFVREVRAGGELAASTLYEVKSGDFVYNRLFAWKGSFAVAGPEHEGCFVSGEFPIFAIDSERLDTRYLFHFFRCPESWNVVLGQSTGGTPTSRNRLREDRFLKLGLPLPSLPEQQRIATKLDAVSEHAASVARCMTRAEAVLGALPASLAQRHDLSDAEKQQHGWLRLTLAEVMTEVSDMRTVEPTETYPNVGILSFGRGLFEKPPIDGSTTSAKKLNRIRASQFIYSRLFAFEGAYASVPDRFDGHFVSGEFPTFELDQSRLLARYLAAYLKSEQTWAELAGSSKGLGVRRQRIHAESLLAYEIWIPPLTHQRQVVAQLERLEQAAHRRQGAAALATALAASALNQAFAGLL
jgi:type I restriction enzyme, S subunit